MIKIIVRGEPRGKDRPRFNRKSGRAYTTKETRQYEESIQAAHRERYGDKMFPKDVPLATEIKAYCSVPASDSKVKRAKKLGGLIRPTKKPDWDNIGKVVADALNKVAFFDDAQIVEAHIYKYYGETPRIEVKIGEVNEKIINP